MDQLISVIIPVYQAEQYLDVCLASIVQQTYTNLEIILVDDGSSDRSLQICKNWETKDSRIKVIHKENGGASSARNAGLKIARGEYIGFVDSDDQIAPNMYQTLYQLIKKSDAQMAICEMEYTNQVKQNEVKPQNVQVQILNQKQLLDAFFRVHGEGDTHSIWNRLIHKSLLQEYQFVEGRMNEDVETCYVLSQKCSKAVYTSEKLYFYTKNPQGVTRSHFSQKKMDLLYIWDLVEKKVEEELPEYKEVCVINHKRAYFTLLSQMVINGYDHGDPELKKAERYLRKQVRSYFKTLIRWKMPVSRKVLLIALCCGFPSKKVNL